MKRKFSYSMRDEPPPACNRKIHPWLSGDFDAFKYHWCTSAYGSNGLWCIVASCRRRLLRQLCLYGILTVGCAILIAVSRYLEGVFSHMGAYGILARCECSYLTRLTAWPGMADWKGDGRSDEHCRVGYRDARIFLCAHNWSDVYRNFASAYNGNSGILRQSVVRMVLIPIYLMISVVLPFSALKAGRGIGMRYRERLGILKSKILESVYSIRDIQIFGAGERKAEEIQRANDEVNHASFLADTPSPDGRIISKFLLSIWHEF